ncbi:hypothetical protein K431DRAFT_284440 [Polychaeton citri CBS 116435]|uniref:DM2 domain-containing protein n=1 Tax=Polychaeton citri CBS 116435 TaxID=1314669 RepID=A0A9P4QBY5_9PEZI|nr:hypothetical protein K431DRAFT_284440 [Polychaeton citri CBS 116435]
MQNYRNAPVVTGGRRGPGPMVAPPQHANQAPPMTHAEIQRQMQEDMRKRDRARNRSMKPTDRDIPEELSEAVVAGDGVEKYRQLREVEKKLDATMVRKRLEVTDNVQRRYARRECTMRIWISNTAQGQPWQVAEEAAGMGDESGILEFGEQNSQATYRVKIEGRLLRTAEEEADDDEGLPEEDKERMRRSNRPRFSQFFKAITVDFDRNPALQPDNMAQIEWRKPITQQSNPRQSQSGIDPSGSEANFDCLEFERKADENINITVSLVPDERYERFKLSPQLADILDADEDDKPGAVEGIWEYCRAMGLQEDSDRRTIICDEPLRKLFGRDQVYFPQVPDFLGSHLTPLPPIQLPYTIRVDRSYIAGDPTATSPIPPSRPTIHDLPHIFLPNPLQRQTYAFHTSKSHISTLRAITAVDDDLALLVQGIHRTNAKLKFYENLSKDPKGFLLRWVGSQRRDLEVILAEDRVKGLDGEAMMEEFRRGGVDGVWGSDVARESVGLWLARGKGSGTSAH